MQPIQAKLHDMPTDTASNSSCCLHHMMECSIQQLLPELRLCSLLLARLPAAATSASRAHSALTCDTLLLALSALVHHAVAASTMAVFSISAPESTTNLSPRPVTAADADVWSGRVVREVAVSVVHAVKV